MAYIEIFHMNMDLNQNFDYEVGNDLILRLPDDLGPMIGSIPTPTASTPFKSFATLSNLDLDVIDVAWELLKVQLIHNQKFWIPHHKFFRL
jgi:hypothetical protein